MSKTTFDELKTFVRTQADADTTDAPDNSLLVYARMAYNDILSRRASWPHLSVQYTFSSIAGTRDYALSSLSVGDMERVTAITNTSNLGTRVVYMTATDAVLYFGSPTAPQATQARAYTIINESTIRLYPTPSSVSTYTVDGFRNAASWPTTAGSVADLPRVFDEAIAMFMLAQYYSSQEDGAMRQLYMQAYEQAVETFIKGETAKRVQPRPMLMGGNNRNVVPSWQDRVRGVLE